MGGKHGEVITLQAGIFIAIDGSDGSGKSTQYKLLLERLKAEGFKVKDLKFPRYDEEASYFVRKYLKGEYGTANSLGPYVPSLFFALDRFDAAMQIQEWLAQGYIVLADRYIGGNKAHQGQKISDFESRKAYYAWLDQLEFDMLHVPRPDLNIILTVPAEVALALIKQRGDAQTIDIHDRDPEHLRQATATYQELCKLYPEEFIHIDCIKNNELMSVPAINNIIWERITPMLDRLRKRKNKDQPNAAANSALANEPRAQAAENSRARYHLPPTLADESSEQYQETMDRLQALHEDLVQKLTEYVRHAQPDQQPALKNQADAVTQLVLPVATTLFGQDNEPQDAVITPQQTDNQKKLAELAKAQSLQPMKGASSQPVAISSFWPKNELDLLPQMLFSYSTLSLEELADSVGEWSYQAKAAAFNLYLNQLSDQSSPGDTALQSAQYTFDIISEYAVFNDLQSRSVTSAVERQALTPHYGYETPKVITEAGLDTIFEECFTLSLQLYQHLLEHGYSEEAQYVTLLGHKLRWQLTLTAHEAYKMIKLCNDPQVHPGSRQLAKDLYEQIAAIHPLLANGMKFTNKIEGQS